MKERRFSLVTCARLILAAAAAFCLLLPIAHPASADGPLLPSYIPNDGKKIPAPTGYIQTEMISGENQPCGAFLNPQDLYRDPATGNLVVADTGNNRVVVLDSSGKYLMQIGGDTAKLNDPEGVFVDHLGNFWIADKGNKRVAVFNPDGTLQAQHTKPDSSFLEGMEFTPSKMVVDRRGFMYIVTGSQDSLGVLVVDSTDRFRGFFGRARVPFNLGRTIGRLLASSAQRKRMLTVQPAPMGNLYLDATGFIYAVSPVLEKDQIQRFNSVGTNVYGEVGTRTGAGKLWEKLRGEEGVTFGETEVTWTWNGRMSMSVPQMNYPQFIDLAVDNLGIVSVIDGRNSQIYQYDQSGNLLTIFGGTGLSEGLLGKPVSISAGEQGYLYVLDNGRGNIQVFRPTELTLQIHEASSEYFNGDYENAARLWGEIAQRNTNFALAHSGLGKAMMGEKRYSEAMQEYYYAENIYGYSAAFGEYRYLWMRSRFTWLGFGLIGAIIAVGATGNKVVSGIQRLVNRLRVVQEQAGLWAVPVMLGLTIVSWMISQSALSFHFRTRRPEEIRLLFESGKILIPWITWCISAVGVGEIFYGEGTLRKIMINSAWALWPLILLPIPVNLVTNIITLDEKILYQIAWFMIWVLLVFEFLQVIKNTHNFEYGQSILVMLLALLGILLIWVLLGLIYALTAEIFRFIGQIILEIYVRMY